MNLKSSKRSLSGPEAALAAAGRAIRVRRIVVTYSTPLDHKEKNERRTKYQLPVPYDFQRVLSSDLVRIEGHNITFLRDILPEEQQPLMASINYLQDELLFIAGAILGKIQEQNAEAYRRTMTPEVIQERINRSSSTAENPGREDEIDIEAEARAHGYPRASQTSRASIKTAGLDEFEAASRAKKVISGLVYLFIFTGTPSLNVGAAISTQSGII